MCVGGRVSLPRTEGFNSKKFLSSVTSSEFKGDLKGGKRPPHSCPELGCLLRHICITKGDHLRNPSLHKGNLFLGVAPWDTGKLLEFRSTLYYSKEEMEVREGSHGYCVTRIAWNPKLSNTTPDHLPQHPSPAFSPQTLVIVFASMWKNPADHQNLLCSIRDDIWKISEAWNLTGGKNIR